MKLILYRFYSPQEGLNGAYQWYIENNYSDYEPFYVDIPDEFSVGETQGGEVAFFKNDDPMSYHLKGNKNNVSIFGGTHVEEIQLKIIGSASQKSGDT